ncbi:hypothetical protein JL721_5653 [Aureococcus anophagefferens]|nr:hypothetical protein JL721_5653 [Aureococcus anophagefferens]
MAALWQWRDDYGWKDYAPSDSAKIEAAHQARDARPVTLGNARYVVLVTNLEQVNQRTGFARRARGARRASGVSAAAASSGAAWEFREGGRWVPFSPADSAALEAASGRGDAGVFAFAAAALDADFADVAGEHADALPAGRLRAVQLLGCTAVHPQHEACALRWLAGGAGRCGVCGVSVGVRTGGQPDNGVMRDWVEDRRCGLPPGRRVVEYDFDDGVQGDRHPNPGRPFSGTYRRCYLPTPEGDAVFAAGRGQRRLAFNVGTSLTTGRSDCVVWAGIHHKTQRTGGAAERLPGRDLPRPCLRQAPRRRRWTRAAPVATVLGVE